MDMLLSSPSFAFIQVLNSISLGMNLFIIAAGLSLIFGVLRVINFAHGVFYMFGAYIMYTVSKDLQLGFFTGVIAAAVGLSIIAIIVERGLFQWLYDKEHLLQLLNCLSLHKLLHSSNLLLKKSTHKVKNKIQLSLI